MVTALWQCCHCGTICRPHGHSTLAVLPLWDHLSPPWSQHSGSVAIVGTSVAPMVTALWQCCHCGTICRRHGHSTLAVLPLWDHLSPPWSQHSGSVAIVGPSVATMVTALWQCCHCRRHGEVKYLLPYLQVTAVYSY